MQPSPANNRVKTMNGRRLCQLALALIAVSASGVALAGRGYYHGGYYHGHGGYYHAHGSVGVFIGPGFYYGGYPWGYPYGYPSPYYYPPAAVGVPASPPQYVEQGPDGPVPAPGPDNAAPPAQALWYHCSKPEGYYPYVHECPGGWQQVPAHPPSGSMTPQQAPQPVPQAPAARMSL
ncbi:hypothetical protein GCM10027081_11020 [Cupriavidus yeoncheonensis]